MSNQFAEYVRSGAFSLQLSERMIYVLLAKAGKGAEDERLNIAPYQALERRGLLSRDSGRPEVTEAGKCVADLLVIAGYCENPNAAQAS